MPVDEPAGAEVSDPELMARLGDGDDGALNVLMDRWAARLTAFFHKMTGQSDEALDLAQETFIRLYHASDRFRPSGNFSTYLFAIAANLARNHARWKRRHPSLPVEIVGGNANPALVDSAPTPDVAMEGAEISKSIDKAIVDLPRDLRESMMLFIYGDMSYAEIASVSGCSPKAVETRIYRARQILKVQLKELRP